MLALGCAAPAAEPASRQVLIEEPQRPPGPEELPRSEPVAIPYRPPPDAGLPYRLVLEYSGDQELAAAAEQGAPPVQETHLLELEYRELPAGSAVRALRFRLDALHYRLAQELPAISEREVELGSDRLRTLADREVVIDLKAAQPREDLTPRKLLGRVFGRGRIDPQGNLLGMQPMGVPVARRFLSEFPLQRALAYARPALPAGRVAPGAVWRAWRTPVSPAGKLGLRMPVDYTLAGFRSLGGIPCAWILIESDQEGEEVRSAAGFAFDRVRTTLRGEAFVEIATSRIRLVQLEDEVRVAYTRGELSPQPTAQHRLRHLSRLRLELLSEREPSEPARWADGSERFGVR